MSQTSAQLIAGTSSQTPTFGDVTLASINGGNSISGARNRIINGDMRIDQRNAGASVTPSNNTYALDRWRQNSTQASKYSCQQNAGAVTPPVGFSQYMGITSLSAYSVVSGDAFWIDQPIEGFNVSDLAWGTANAKTVTLSFWVRSSLTGTFGGQLRNSSLARSYPYSYTINSSNTWEQKTITISGDTSGTWAADNSTGIYVGFNLGAGSTFSGTANTWAGANYIAPTGATSVVSTNGATFYITGVQLEAGTVATPFERRSYGQELALCQRYFATVGDGGNPYAVLVDGRFSNSTYFSCRWKLPVTMRATPSATAASATYALWDGATARTVGAIAIYSVGPDGVEGDITTASATIGGYGQLRGNAASPNAPRILFSSEL